MESDRYDVIVVGAGVSGLVTAGAAAHRNLKVALVATGPGSFVTGPGWLKAQDILRASAAPELGEAIAFFCEMARRAGCPYAGDISTAKYLPTLLGDFQSVALAPLLLWNAEPRDGVSTAVIGIRGLSGFDECFMAERLSERARAMSSSGTYAARQISLSRDMGAPVTTLHLAQLFDRDPGFRKELVYALRAAASGFASRLFSSASACCSTSGNVWGRRCTISFLVGAAESERIIFATCCGCAAAYAMTSRPP